MKRFPILAFAFGTATVAACSGLGEALTAHTEVVATAGSQELSVERLGNLLGKAKLQLPINREVATLVARDLWIPYQLLALAAARNDSLSDPKLIDAAAAGMMENTKLSRFMESVSAKFAATPLDSVAYMTGKGDLFSARHILFLMPKDATPLVRDSVRRLADSVQKKVTPANFADLAKKFSGDNTAARGGDLGVFPRTMMVKPFADALAKLKPGEISPLVATQFGFHILQRNTWDQAKVEYLAQSGNRVKQLAESTYIDSAQKEAGVDIMNDAGMLMKDVARDPLSHRKDNTVLAKYKNGGEVTSGKLALVLLMAPQSAKLMQQIIAAPDSLVRQYIYHLAQRDVLLRRADAAKIGVTPEEVAALHRDFVQAMVQSWATLGVDPKSLSDSGKTAEGRERIAAARVEKFLDKIVAGEAQPMPIPMPLQLALMDKYDSKVNATGVDRAVERALKVKAAADSAKKVGMPESAVPLPGGAPPQPPPATKSPAPVPKKP